MFSLCFKEGMRSESDRHSISHTFLCLVFYDPDVVIKRHYKCIDRASNPSLPSTTCILDVLSHSLPHLSSQEDKMTNLTFIIEEVIASFSDDSLQGISSLLSIQFLLTAT